MLEERISVESPGSLSGLVRLNNLRTVHISRNQQIVEFLHQYEYVKEFDEGVDRMFNEMKNAGLPDSEYTGNAFMLNLTIRNNKVNGVVNDEVNGEVNGEVNFDGFNRNEVLVFHALLNNST